MNKAIEAARIQEEQYEFPYHHLPRFERGTYVQSATHRWGYEYFSYIEFVQGLLERRSWDSLLDVGCGDGKFVYELSKHYRAKALQGIDISERAISLARGIYPNGAYLAGDITKNPFEGKTFDVITLIETLEHIPPEAIPAFLDGVAAHLSKDGVFIVTVPSVNVPTAKKHFQHFSADSLAKTLSPRFKVVETFYLNRISFFVNVIERLLSNRFFYLSEPHLSMMLYRLYTKRFLRGSERDTKRLCVVCTRA